MSAFLLLSSSENVQMSWHKLIILALYVASVLMVPVLPKPIYSVKLNRGCFRSFLFLAAKQRLFSFVFRLLLYLEDSQYHSILCSVLTEVISIFSFIFHSWSLPNKRRLFTFTFRFTVFRLLCNLTWDYFRSSFFMTQIESVVSIYYSEIIYVLLLHSELSGYSR